MRANVWIDALPGFRELTLEMFEAFDRTEVGGTMLRADRALARTRRGIFRR
jgi:hypothetical protein